MALSEQLRFKLSKRYQPDSMVEMKYKGNDLSFKTDEEGNPILLFIGGKKETGKIRGERYIRTLKKDSQGKVMKDHWDLKGKVS